VLVDALPATIALAVAGVGQGDVLRRVLLPMNYQLLLHRLVHRLRYLSYEQLLLPLVDLLRIVVHNFMDEGITDKGRIIGIPGELLLKNKTQLVEILY